MKSNIFRFVKERPVLNKDAKFLLQKIMKYRSSLPFSERWCARYLPKPNKALFKLVRSQIIAMYPILKDKDGGMVSQTEHSVIVTEDGCEVYT